MSITRVSPAEAHRLVDVEGFVLLDVRSVSEFESGHPTGAYNIPLSHAGPVGMTPNTDFLRVVESTFPKDTKLVVACKSGIRSLKAAKLLVEAGYAQVVDQRAGWVGASDPFGRGIEPGWHQVGLPSSLTPTPGRSWLELLRRATH